MTDLNMLAFLNRIGGQTNPPNIFLFLRYNIHGHKDIKSIIHTPSNILVINWLQRV